MKYYLDYSRKHTLLNLLKMPLRHCLWMLGKYNLSKVGQRYVAAFDYITTEIIVDGVFESKLLDCLGAMFEAEKPLCMNREVCVDIGANIGNHSRFFASYFNEVLAFEPNPSNYALLLLNKTACNINCYPIALSDSTGKTTFVLNDSFNSGSYTSKSDNSPQSYRVDTTTLDEFISTTPRIDLIKIDTEGHEYSVLKGAEKLIRKFNPVIIFEQGIDQWKNHTTASIELLRSFGYNDFMYLEKRFDYPALGRFAIVFRFILILIFGDRYSFVSRAETPRRFHDMVIGRVSNFE